MKMVHWNISKEGHPMSALRKYEDVLFSYVEEFTEDRDIERIWRREGKILGSTIFSWLLAISEK